MWEVMIGNFGAVQKVMHVKVIRRSFRTVGSKFKWNESVRYINNKKEIVNVTKKKYQADNSVIWGENIPTTGDFPFSATDNDLGLDRRSPESIASC